MTAFHEAQILIAMFRQAASMRLIVLWLLAFALLPSGSSAQAPVFEITPLDSWIKFDVKASVDIAGKFDKWNAT
jgi:hypothetical protein